MVLYRNLYGGSPSWGAGAARTGLLARVGDGVVRRISFRRVSSCLKQPVASFTFDDFPRSAWTVGGTLLQRYGARATYYAAARFCGAVEDGIEYYDADDLRALHEAGHEVGCHTYRHRRSPQLTSRELRTELERNQAFIHEVLGDVTLSSFAYPYGAVSLRSKALVSRRFASGRGIYSGVNTGPIDLGQLRVVRLERYVWSVQGVERQVDTARRTNGWLVFMSHDISDDPSPYGASPAMLEHALAAVRSAGIEILPVKHALARVIAS